MLGRESGSGKASHVLRGGWQSKASALYWRRLYLENLEGRMPADLFEDLRGRIESELTTIQAQLGAHQAADRKYLEFGVRLLELAQSAYSSYLRRSPTEKRRLEIFPSELRPEGGIPDPDVPKTL